MPGIFIPSSPNVVSCRRQGVPAIANTASPQSGPDGTTQFQAVLDLNKAGGPFAGQAMTVLVDIPILTQGDNTVNPGTIVQGLGSFKSVAAPASGLWFNTTWGSRTSTSILRNATYVSGYPSSPNGTTIVDHDIILRDLYLNGQRGSYNGQVNPNSGVICALTKMYGVNNLLFDNVSGYDPICYGFHCSNISLGSFLGIHVLDPFAFATPATGFRGTCVIQLDGPQGFITIKDVSGSTGDDAIAFNMGEAGAATNSGFGGYNNTYYGSMKSALVENVNLINATNVIRIYTGLNPNNSAPCNIGSLTVRHVNASVVYGPVESQPAAWEGGTSGGSVGFLLLDDWQVTSVGLSGVAANSAGVQLPNCLAATVRNFRYTNLTSGELVHQIVPQGSITNLTVENHEIVETSGEITTPAPAILLTGLDVNSNAVSIGTLTVRGCRWNRNATTSQAFVSMTGGTCGNMRFIDNHMSNINNLLNITGGTITASIDSTGLTHTGANSNASFALGVVVPRFRASNSDTVLLLSGTAPTSSKTDSTQDA